MNEAALQAEIMKGFQQEQPQPQGGPQGPQAGANPIDPTGAGGGTIGTGQAPVPGEQGFSANGQEANTQQPQAAGGQQPPMGSVQ
jgi:hypothetical protein